MGTRAARLCSTVLALTSCTHDFDALTVGNVGGGDGAVDARDSASEAAADGPVADVPAPVDTSCTAPTACTDAAKSCGDACGATRASCDAACTNPGCKKTCKDAETACRNKCNSDCHACSSTAGCASALGCQAASGL